MQPWCAESTQVTDSAKQNVVNDVSFGSEVRILATTLPQFALPKLFQLRVFRFRSDEDGNIRVRVFPEHEEILIGRLGFCGVALYGIGTRKLQMRQRADGFVEHNSTVVKDFLELRRRLTPMTCNQMGFSSYINWIYGLPCIKLALPG